MALDSEEPFEKIAGTFRLRRHRLGARCANLLHLPGRVGFGFHIWFRPGGELTLESVARMLAEIFLFGVANPSHP